MFDYTVMSKEEAEKARYSLLDKGTYEAALKVIEDRLSKNGDPQIILNVNVYDKNGNIHIIKEWLTFSKKMMWKVLHCMKACGLQDEYTSKKFQPLMLDNKVVKVSVGIQKGQPIPDHKLGDRPPGTFYPDQNCIDDYCVSVNHEPSKLNPIKSDPEFDSEIPF